MDSEHLMKLVAILALVAGNAFFVGSEIALTSARRSRIKQLADMGNKSAKIVQILHREPERFYSVTQIGITLVSLALGAIGMVTISDILDPFFVVLFGLAGDSAIHKGLATMAHTASYAIAFVIISYLHVVAGELAPKVLAFHKAETLSLTVAWIINFLYRSFSWLIWVMNKSSNALLWVFGQRDLAQHHEGHFSMSEEEIRTILQASEKDGILNPDETQMIRGVFDLDEFTVRDAMIPRTDVHALTSTDTVGDALKLFSNSRHARYPVFEGDLDNVIGVVAMKELLGNAAEHENLQEFLGQPVGRIVLPPFIVPESKPLFSLLRDFKAQAQHMAIVIDEFGGTAGLITLEDILEEIVGEYDDEFTHRHRMVKKVEDGAYLINASARVTDLEPVLNFPFNEDPEFVTLAGLVYKHLGRVPSVGDTVDLEGARMEVVEMERHRIIKVRFAQKVMSDAVVTDEASAPGNVVPAA